MNQHRAPVPLASSPIQRRQPDRLDRADRVHNDLPQQCMRSIDASTCQSCERPLPSGWLPRAGAHGSEMQTSPSAVRPPGDGGGPPVPSAIVSVRAYAYVEASPTRTYRRRWRSPCRPTGWRGRRRRRCPPSPVGRRPRARCPIWPPSSSRPPLTRRRLPSRPSDWPL